MHVVEFSYRGCLCISALGTSVGLFSLGGLGSGSGYDSFVPYVRSESVLFVGVTASSGVPVIFAVKIPVLGIERMYVVEFSYRGGFCLSALGTSVGLFSLGGLGSGGGDYSLVPYVVFED
mgnify:CR=1 FL=1